jgi:hypothetical protein
LCCSTTTASSASSRATRRLDWEALEARYGDIQRLDRLLEAEGDTPNRYEASKQADVLMLFYLFSAEELEQLFEHEGWPGRGAGSLRRHPRVRRARPAADDRAGFTSLAPASHRCVDDHVQQYRLGAG